MSDQIRQLEGESPGSRCRGASGRMERYSRHWRDREKILGSLCGLGADGTEFVWYIYSTLFPNSFPIERDVNRPLSSFARGIGIGYLRCVIWRKTEKDSLTARSLRSLESGTSPRRTVAAGKALASYRLPGLAGASAPAGPCAQQLSAGHKEESLWVPHVE